MDPIVLCITTPMFEAEMKSEYEEAAFLAKNSVKLFETLKVFCDTTEAARSLLSGDTLKQLKVLEEYMVQMKLTDQYRAQKVNDRPRRSSITHGSNLMLDP